MPVPHATAQQLLQVVAIHNVVDPAGYVVFALMLLPAGHDASTQHLLWPCPPPQPQMWQLLAWQGRHPQAPIAVAQRPHYFCELDVPRSVRHLLK